MNNSELQKVDNHKHLVVIFSNNGFWHDHVDHIVKRSYNMLRKVRMTLDRLSLEKIYMSFIRPLLEYADVIWDSQNQSLINKLENVQLDDARIVTEGTKLTGLNRLYEETKWEKLSDRRQNHKLILFHKLKNNRTPQYLLDLIPNSIGSRHNHTTRQVNNMLEINTRTNQYADYRYFLPSTIKLWNNLPLTLRKTESLIYI